MPARLAGASPKLKMARRAGAVVQGARPELDGAFAVDAVALMAEGVLIDGDDLSVGEDGLDLGGS